MPELLEVTDLHVNYGKVTALRGLSLSIPPSNVIALVGANGAGKTTLVRSLTGCLSLHGGRIISGDVMYGGSGLGRQDSATIARRGVVHVPEGRRIFAHMTVEENLKVAALATRDRGRRDTQWQAVHELFPILQERSSQKAGLLSGGEQQMLAIGRGLMLDPQVLLLDEPSLGLAPAMVDRIAEAIRSIGATGISILLIEQNATLALELSTYAYVLETGVVSMQGPSAKIGADPAMRDLYLGGSVDTGAAAAAGATA
jgi:branched-chain amino acid transport system ATP-binding protein